MRRSPDELRVMQRQQREAAKRGKPRPIGYFRNRDAHDCGNPRCGLCHRDKRFGYTPNRQELAARLRITEQLLDSGY